MALDVTVVTDAAETCDHCRKAGGRMVVLYARGRGRGSSSYITVHADCLYGVRKFDSMLSSRWLCVNRKPVAFTSLELAQAWLAALNGRGVSRSSHTEKFTTIPRRMLLDPPADPTRYYSQVSSHGSSTLTLVEEK